MLVSLSVGLSACGGNAKVNVSAPSQPIVIEPNSHQVMFIESTSTAETMLRATGIGSDLGHAITDSKRAALWFALLGGDTPILQTLAERKQFKTVQNSVYKNANKYVTFDGGIKAKRVESGQTYVDKVYRINVQMLKDDLVAEGVIKPTDELDDDMVLPVIAPMPASHHAHPDLMRHGMDVVAEYLQDRDFEVKVLNGQHKTASVLKKALAVSGNIDPMYLLALENGSDIYVDYNPTIEGTDFKKAAVSIKAYYTATSRQVAATTGYSASRRGANSHALVQEGTNDAADKITAQILKSWKKELKKGRYFKVVVTVSETHAKAAYMPLTDALSAVCKIVEEKAGSTVFDFVVRCKKMESARDVLKALSNHYTGPGQIFRELNSGAMLLIKIADNAADEIEIE
jgi:hypothetical protein